MFSCCVSFAEVVNSNRYDYGLSSARDARTEQRLARFLLPRVELRRFEKPLPGAFLFARYDVVLVYGEVDR